MADENTNGGTEMVEIAPQIDVSVTFLAQQIQPTPTPSTQNPLPEPISTAAKPQGGAVVKSLNSSPVFHPNMMINGSFSGASGRHDHYLKLSYVLTACFLFCFAWPSLPFTLPAIYFAKMARRADAKRDTQLMIRNERIALILNVGGMVAYVTLFVAVITVVIAMKGENIMAYQHTS